MADGDDAAGGIGAAQRFASRRDAMAHVAETAAELGRIAAGAGLAEAARLLSLAAAGAVACSRRTTGCPPSAKAIPGG